MNRADQAVAMVLIETSNGLGTHLETDPIYDSTQ